MSQAIAIAPSNAVPAIPGIGRRVHMRPVCQSGVGIAVPTRVHAHDRVERPLNELYKNSSSGAVMLMTGALLSITHHRALRWAQRTTVESGHFNERCAGRDAANGPAAEDGSTTVRSASSLPALVLVWALLAIVTTVVGCAGPKMRALSFPQPDTGPRFDFSVRSRIRNHSVERQIRTTQDPSNRPSYFVKGCLSAVQEYCDAMAEGMFGRHGTVSPEDTGSGPTELHLPTLELIAVEWTSDQFDRVAWAFAHVTTFVDGSWGFFSARGELLWYGEVRGSATTLVGDGFTFVSRQGDRASCAIEDLFVKTCQRFRSTPVFYEYERFADLFEAEDDDKLPVLRETLAHLRPTPNFEQSVVMLANYAISIDRSDLFSHLLSLGVDLDDYAPARNRKPLHLAAQLGRADALKDLLRMCTNVDDVSKEGLTPLAYAASGRHVDCVAQLVAVGAQPVIDIQDDPYQNARANESLAYALLDKGFVREALACARTSGQAYEESVARFDRQITNATVEIWARRILIAMAAATELAGAKYQATMRAHANAEIDALRNRGVGVGYGAAWYHGYPGANSPCRFREADQVRLKKGLIELRDECKAKAKKMFEFQTQQVGCPSD